MTPPLTDTSGKGVCSQCLSSKGTEEDILMLQCSLCSCFIHTSCLRVENPPFTTLAGDNFFDLVCSECSGTDDGYDVVKRGRMKVHVAILLALYNLHKNSPRPAQDGFYHWKDDIFAYINRHHHLIFPQEQNRIVPASFCATMTKFPNWIESGNCNPKIKGRGFYRLVTVKPPAVLLMQSGVTAPSPAASVQRPVPKRGVLGSRFSATAGLRSPRTRQDVRDLASAFEEASAEESHLDDSALTSSNHFSDPTFTCSSYSPSTTTTTTTTTTESSSTASLDNEEEASGSSPSTGNDRHSRYREAGNTTNTARHLKEKRGNESPGGEVSGVVKRRRGNSGSWGPRNGPSLSPRTRFSPRTNIGNSSPGEGNFKWLENISADTNMDKNLDMIFSDDFLAIANVEEVGSSATDHALVSGVSPGQHVTTEQNNPRDDHANWMGSSERNFKPNNDLQDRAKSSSNSVLQGDTLRNSLSSSQAKKMLSKNRNRDKRFLSPRSAGVDRTNHRVLQPDHAALDTRGRPTASSSQLEDCNVPYKRHKLALSFRQNKPPFVLDKQYKEDLQFVDSFKPKTVQEEMQLLQQLNRFYAKVGSAGFPSLLVPLRRKLQVRKEQRQHGIGVFNAQAEAKCLQEKKRCLTNQERIALEFDKKVETSGYHILDRFLKAENAALLTPFGDRRLFGGDVRAVQPFISPYSGKLLLPYHLQLKDYKRPLKLLLNEEIEVHAVVGELTREYNPIPPPEGTEPITPPEHAIRERMKRISYGPLHFAPVRPEHIPQMNALARQFFWPGINLAEVLNYPEFTCVALYKFLVIGFGVAVPDMGLCGEEAYLSFLLVHPEWRRSKIASTILYCLSEEIRTDTTVHVSPSNPAMNLFLLFGFKTEKIIKNFYNKYLPAKPRARKPPPPEEEPSANNRWGLANNNNSDEDRNAAVFMRRRRIL